MIPCFLRSVHADQKLTQLNETTTPSATDYMYIVTNSSSMKVTPATILSLPGNSTSYITISSQAASNVVNQFQYLQKSSAAVSYLGISSATPGGSQIYPATATPSFPFGLSASTMVINNGSALGILSGASRARLRMGGILSLQNVNTDSPDSSGVFVAAASSSTGASTFYTMRRASGTTASPVATSTGQLVGQVSAGGYGTTNWAGSSTGRIDFTADESFTDSSQATSINLYTTPSGSTSTVLRTSIAGNGSITDYSSHTIQSSLSATTGTFTAPVSITNTGTGNSFLVEDSASVDSTPFVIDASGNVGVGTPTPAAKVDITAATTDLVGLSIFTANTTDNAYSVNFNRAGTNVQNAFNWQNAGVNKWFFGQDNDSTNNIFLYSWTANRLMFKAFDATGDIGFGNSLNQLYIQQSNGYVGIGMQAPARPLHVFDPSAPVIEFSDNTSGSTSTDGFQIQYISHIPLLWNYGNTDMVFGTNNIERMRILANGNVGISTSIPNYKLDVNGVINSTGVLTNNIPLGLSISTYSASGTYAFTTTSATIAIGTSSSTITLPNPGTYRINALANMRYTGATFAANQFVTLNLYRQNNTPGVIPNSQTQEETGVVTTITNQFGQFNLPDIIYTTTNSNDVISLQGSITATPAAGNFQATEANILAVRIQ